MLTIVVAAALLAAPTLEPVVPPPEEGGAVVPAIEWRGGSRCPSQAKVRDRVQTLLGAKDDRVDPEREVVAQAEQASDGTWTVTLELSSEDGVRTRVVPGGRDCAEVAEAAAVVIAIAIDPTAASRAAATEPITAESASETETETETEPETETETEPETEPEPEPETEPEPEPEPEPETETETEGDRAPRPPVVGLAGLGGGLGFGNIPPVSGHVALDGGITLARVRVTASVQYWFRSTEEVGNATVDFRQWSVAARGCPVFAVRPILELLVCGGVEAGQTLVTTRGLTEGTAEPDAAWIAWLLQPALVVLPRPWLGVRAGVELFGPFSPVTYDVGDTEIFAHGIVGLRGILAVEARFGGLRPAGG